MDEELRRLERDAARGDPLAAEALERARSRSGNGAEALIRELRFAEVLWEGAVSIELFGRAWDVRLSLDGEAGAPIEPALVTALERFLGAYERLRPEIEAAVLRYRVEEVPTFTDREHLTTSVSTLADLPGCVTPRAVHISDFDEARRVALLFDCDWDPEHGVGVLLVDEVVAKVADQGSVL